MWAKQSPTAHYIGDETLYHFTLRCASSALTGINMHYSARFGYLAARVPYISYGSDPTDPDGSRDPDARSSVIWAERALRAILGKDWVWMTWQITDKAYLVSLH